MKLFIVMVLLIFHSLTLFSDGLPNGLGTEDDPYIISNVANLQYLSNHSSLWASDIYIVQSDSINCSGVVGFEPIGESVSNPFKGNYDGRNHTIANLVISSSEDYVGLFGRTEGATISNLKIVNATITGKKYVGAVTGFSKSTSIINCSSSGTIKDTDPTTAFIGGISGAATFASHIKYCYSSVTLNGVNRIGGITGALGDNSTLKNSSFTGEILNGFTVGGLVGSTDFATLEISNCYSKCTIEHKEGNERGMLIGYNNIERISSCAYLFDNTIGYVGAYNNSLQIDADANQIIELSMEEFSQAANFTEIGWDFDTIWSLRTDDISPTLFWQQNSSSDLIEITNPGTSNYSAPAANAELEFLQPPAGSNFLINMYSINDSPISGLNNSQQIVGDDYWSIKTNLTDTLSYTLKLNLGANLTSLEQETIKVLKRVDSASPWIDITDLGGVLTLQENIAIITGLSSFSDFVFIMDSSTLPVELSSFTAIVNENSVIKINWTVESESNLLGYYLLRNENNSLASATTIPSLIQAENTLHTHHYSFQDYPDTESSILYYWLKSVELSNESETFGPVQVRLNINENSNPVINLGNQLYANYPNPFNPETAISFNLAQAGLVSLNIYNARGQQVKTLLENEQMGKGYHSFIWDSRDNCNQNVASGLYLYRLETKNFSEMGRMILLK